MNETLFLITARGGSKGIPGKNIMPLGGKPLLHYAIQLARKFVNDEWICLSTDDDKIIDTAGKIGLKTPFRRPKKLATDKAGSYEVMLHAVNFYEKQEKKISRLVLLQPTSPFRLYSHVKECMALYDDKTEMVISVVETSSNPYYLFYTENKKGFLEKMIKTTNLERRQDAPAVYEINGAVYVINVNALKKRSPAEFRKVKKYVMPVLNSVDIDTPDDKIWAEYLLEKNKITFDYE